MENAIKQKFEQLKSECKIFHWTWNLVQIHKFGMAKMRQLANFCCLECAHFHSRGIIEGIQH